MKIRGQWRKGVRTNAKTVTVETGCSWTDKTRGLKSTTVLPRPRRGQELPDNKVAPPDEGWHGRAVTLTIQCLDIDTIDPDRLARFWQQALGWRRTHAEPDEVVLEPPAGSPQDGVVPDLLFLRVPEDKAGKNRLHLDLRPDDQAAEVTRLEALGARRVDVGQDKRVSWVVLADPDGNEFCVLRAFTADELASFDEET